MIQRGTTLPSEDSSADSVCRIFAGKGGPPIRQTVSGEFAGVSTKNNALAVVNHSEHATHSLDETDRLAFSIRTR